MTGLVGQKPWQLGIFLALWDVSSGSTRGDQKRQPPVRSTKKQPVPFLILYYIPLQMARDAIKAYLESMKKHGEEFRDDSDTVEAMLTMQYG
jgi:hypothetical protein